jgi:endonuclease YncB( thermonuclease family)
MRLFAMLFRAEIDLFEKLGTGATGRTFSLVAGLSLLATALFVAGCGQPSVPEQISEVTAREGTLILPTSAPTLAPSPVNTRVLPLEVMTPVPTNPISPTVTPIPDEVQALVVEVIDGDTISVVMDGDPPSRVYVVRYLGIDAPPNAPDSPWGAVAYQTNRKLTNLKAVSLVKDQTDVDEEGRLLRHVLVGNDLVSILLAEQGLARADVTEPDIRFQAEIEEAETRARNNRLGLWGQLPTPAPTVTQPADEAEETVEPEETAASLEDTPEPSANTPAATDSELSNASSTPSVAAEEVDPGE